MTSSAAVAPGIYRHHKGGLYRVLFVAKHHETEERFVVYAPTDGSHLDHDLRLRELTDWKEHVPESATSPNWVPRFSRVDDPRELIVISLSRKHDEQ